MTREEARTKLAQLGAWVSSESRKWLGGFDGGDIQDKMHELGLIVIVPVTDDNVTTVHEFCEEACVDEDCLHYADGVQDAEDELLGRKRGGDS